MRRLSAVSARLEPVLRADWNIELLFVVAVHVTEPHVVRAVRVDVEALVHRCHTLTVPVPKLCELRRRGLSNRTHSDYHDRDRAQTPCPTGHVGRNCSAKDEARHLLKPDLCGVRRVWL